MRVRVTLPDGHHEILDIEGHDLTVGRADECDVVIGEIHVSKRHVRLLRGTVAIDLNSANGTYVGGERLHEARLIPDEGVLLGQSGIRVEVLESEREPAVDAGESSSQVPEIAAPLHEERALWEQERADLVRECAELRAQLEEARSQALPETTLTPQEPPARQEAFEMNAELREILASLRSDNSRVLESLAGLRRRLEERPAAPTAPLNTATSESTPVSGLFFRLQGENQELRQRLAELEQRQQPPAESTPAHTVETDADAGRTFESGH